MVGVVEADDEVVVLSLIVVLALELVVELVMVDEEDSVELMLAFFWYKLNLLPAPQYSKLFPKTQTKNRQNRSKKPFHAPRHLLPLQVIRH